MRRNDMLLQVLVSSLQILLKLNPTMYNILFCYISSRIVFKTVLQRSMNYDIRFEGQVFNFLEIGRYVLVLNWCWLIGLLLQRFLTLSNKSHLWICINIISKHIWQNFETIEIYWFPYYFEIFLENVHTTRWRFYEHHLSEIKCSTRISTCTTTPGTVC